MSNAGNKKQAIIDNAMGFFSFVDLVPTYAVEKDGDGHETSVLFFIDKKLPEKSIKYLSQDSKVAGVTIAGDETVVRYKLPGPERAKRSASKPAKETNGKK